MFEHAKVLFTSLIFNLLIRREEKFVILPPMQLFYTPDVRGGYAYFEEEEARHIVQVLRHRVGDELHFVDGEGGY